jgi:formate dehydrogenase alpha subunit
MTNDLVLTTCPFCGCGCSFYLVVVNGKVIDIAPCFTDRISQGKLCVKGRQAHEFIDSEHRLRSPLIRKNGQLKEASWDEALDFVAKGLSSIKSGAGQDAIGLLSSAKCTNEENYLMMKFSRAVIGTNNVDHCARLCHASTVVGLVAAFGSGAMTNSIPEVAQAECILITGTNTIEQHPLIGSRVLQAIEHGATLIVIDPRHTPLSDKADFFLRQKPGTDVAWLNGFMNIIIEEGLHDSAFIEERTEGFEDLAKTVANYTPEKVEQITGISAEQLIQAARAYAGADSAMIL